MSKENGWSIRIEYIFAASIILPLLLSLIGKLTELHELERFAGYFAILTITLLIIFAFTSIFAQKKFLSDAKRRTSRSQELILFLKNNSDFLINYTDCNGASFEARFDTSKGFLKKKDNSDISLTEEDLIITLSQAKEIRTYKAIG